MSILALTLASFVVPMHNVDVYRHALASVAWVHSNGQGKGTGWIVDVKRRWLLTCYHITGENNRVEVFFPAHREEAVVARRGYYLEERPRLRKQGLVVTGRVLKRDPKKDLALVELESLPKGVLPLHLAKHPPKIGVDVQLLGNRYDMSALWGHATGTVRARRVFEDGYYNAGKKLGEGARILEADVPINEGDSGGPLLNAKGEVVGLATAVEWKKEGMGLFVDIEELRAFLAKNGWNEPDERRIPLESKVERLGPEELRSRIDSCSVVVRPKHTGREALGFLIDREQRLVVTTAEVIDKEKLSEISFANSDTKRIALTLKTDRRRNLALLALIGKPHAKSSMWANTLPEPGEVVYLGSSEGIRRIAVRQRGTADLRLSKAHPDPAVLFLQAEPGLVQSGAGLLDGQGRLVGMGTGKSAPQQQLSYAITVDEIRAFLEECRPLWNPNSPTDWIARGRRYRDVGLHAEAVKAFTSVLEASPTNVIARCERGFAYLALAKLKEADRDCKEGLRLGPKLALAHRLSGEVLAARGQLRPALSAMDTALSLDREDPLAYAFRASLHRRLGNLRLALADIDEALWFDRNSAEIYLERSRIHYAKADWRAVLRDLDRCLALNPRLAEAWALQANTYWNLDDVPATLDACERWIQLRPNEGDAYLLRGRGRLVRKDVRGLRDFEKALQWDETRVEAIEHSLLRWSRSSRIPAEVRMAVQQGLAEVEAVVDRSKRLNAVRKLLDSLASLEVKDP